MKKILIFLSLTYSMLIGCSQKEKPFKPALEQIIIHLSDSLKYELGKNKLLSIEFFNYRRCDQNYTLKIFVSNWYSGCQIDGFTKLGETTIAIYNLKDDICEMVNKNNITYFTDTLIGYKDTCVLYDTKNAFYYSIDNNHINKINHHIEFPFLKLVRIQKCKQGTAFNIPKDCWFYWDSIYSEEDLKYYLKEVDYYHNQGKRNVNNNR